MLVQGWIQSILTVQKVDPLNAHSNPTTFLLHFQQTRRSPPAAIIARVHVGNASVSRVVVVSETAPLLILPLFLSPVRRVSAPNSTPYLYPLQNTQCDQKGYLQLILLVNSIRTQTPQHRAQDRGHRPILLPLRCLAAQERPRYSSHPSGDVALLAGSEGMLDLVKRSRLLALVAAILVGFPA